MSSFETWPHVWSVEVLTRPPLIAPARQFTYPLQIAGEEDALARGALHLLIRSTPGQPPFLATCALGFRDPTMPTGVYATPNPRELCAVAGGYAYLIDTQSPEVSTHIPLKPVTAILPIPTHDLLIFSSFHTLLAWGKQGIAWTTARLSWEGITLGETTATHLQGKGWNMLTDRELPFEVDLLTGQHTGGGFTP
ncbi:hypothetical protein [Granulicella sibirica]|uniref:Uncharacterized protein n=1 Tax=Granulicella sibirica TaxID=2479048 RepID=A0A4Q0T7D1_9BACT|nr:hypothetical protein [Granulicella sibirica]RXH57586.1 hypothetical protein GRAN_0896 [Granulicella sibirica]